MGISKVILNGVTKVDLTQDTVASNNLLSGETATGADGEAVEGAIASKASADLTVSGATVTAPAGFYSAAASKSVATTTHPNPTASINSSTGVVTASHIQGTGYVTGGTTTGTLNLTTQAAKTVTPTESEQTAVAAGRYTTGAVKVGAISSTYIGSDITQRDSDDLTASGATVSVPAGYYASSASKSVASGSATTPATTITANPSISVNSSGLITATTSKTQNITPTVSAGYVSAGTAGTVTVSGSNTSQLTTQAAKTVTPSTSSQTAVASGVYTTGAVTVAAMPSGTAGTPTATKGTVSNHSVTVTPSVTNTTGYITGGTQTGTAVTVSVAELESGTKSITENGTGISVSGYSTVDVNVESAPSITVSPLSVTQNGTYTAPTGTAYSPVTVDVSGGTTVEEKDVNFIDYDGTVVYSYTASEFAQLSALPNNPGHAGLTAQGWNWSLADAKTYVAKYGQLIIGQSYVTTSGATEIDITLTESTALSPILFFCVNGTATIDWGDNSATNTVTGTSLTTLIFTQHTYSQIGSYTISIAVNSGTVQFYNGNSSHAGLFSFKETPQSGNCYSNSVTAIRLGTGIALGMAAFRALRSLKSVTIPTSLTTIGQYMFEYCASLSSLTLPYGLTTASSYLLRYCYGLGHLSLPSTLTTANTYAFASCYVLKKVSIPSNVTSLGTNVLRNDHGLASVIIPDGITSLPNYMLGDAHSITSLTITSGVTSIGGYTFNNCYSMQFYHFLSTTPPTLSANNFTDIRSDAKIYVPYSADHSVLNAYKTETNWSTVADYMEEE